ncbi:uncharacterized protein LOC118422453 isoform X2 [Branchiostoma floridae]|uniref:Uncharacterized protein LOC118422453 isoform X2 n=1 Tax=Branchiostoma floridae TaxID=7739 RepID=A0A9J7LPY3_BRAFL|nr:uncharacterized protein LOC118422453 isoform X2 [Branchiostoma floridae]
MMAVRVVVVFALAIVAHGNVLQDETVDGLLGEASAGAHHLFDSLDDSAVSGMTQYTRWGKTMCPGDAVLVYKGIMAGSWYSHSGSGSNFLCLPEDPEWMEYSDATDGQRGFVAGAEYETDRNAPFAIHDQHDAPCAVCAIPRGTSLMIPAKMSCPTGWIQEYSGYLMAAKYSHRRTDFVCVDVEAQHEDGGDANNNGALLYLVEGRCNYNLPCPPYVNGRELTCVVCSAGVKPVTT